MEILITCITMVYAILNRLSNLFSDSNKKFRLKQVSALLHVNTFEFLLHFIFNVVQFKVKVISHEKYGG